MHESFAFRTDIVVRVGDINYGGHLGNDKFLLLFHDARIRWLQSFGLTEKDVGEGTGLIMSEAHVVFKGESFLGDTLTVGVKAAEPEGSRFRLEYEVERQGDAKIVAAGYTVMVAFDYGARRVAKIPAGFREILSAQPTF